MKRRTVHKINPARHPSFDQQLWPVLVAVTVLCGIGFGAVLTILRGPWMWGSLFLLPLIAIGSIVLLSYLDNTRLRRSLQFAIVASLAAHLFILIIASAVIVFENPSELRDPKIAQRPTPRTIEISDQRASFVWEQTNAQETPEPEVEPQRKEAPTTETKPQPVPVKETQPAVNPQLVKRKTPAETVPRQNRERSLRRRQTKNLKPALTQQLTGKKPTPRQSKSAANAPASPQPAASSAPRAESIARQPASNPAPTATAAAPRSESKPEIARTASTTPSPTRRESTPQSSSSSARIRRRTPRIPIASSPAPVSEKITPATTTTSMKAEPAKSANQLTRRPTQSDTVQPAHSSQPKTELNPRAQIARSALRRQTQPVQPSISNSDSTSRQPRRSTNTAMLATSPVSVENPARAPESKTASRDLSSKTLSISRSTAGVTGAGRSSNLDRSIGGVTSPARRTSDSAQRARTESRANDARMLSSSQKSEARRAIGSASLPTSSLKSDTRAPAKIAGNPNPTNRSLESSAAQITSASTQSRDERSAEKGTASVDIGPTKIVADQVSRRLSGGGQPEILQLNPESTRRSREQSNQRPSLVASRGAESAAPSNLSTPPSAADATLQPTTNASVASRAQGDAAVSAERATSQTVGEISDVGQTKIANWQPDSRQRANRDSEETSWNEDDDEDENRRGLQRTRLTQAPVTRLQPGMGIAKSSGRSKATPDSPDDSPLESYDSNVSRSSTASTASSGVGRSPTNDPVASELTSPTPNPSRGRSNRRANSQATRSEIAATPKSNSTTRGRRSNQSIPGPTLAVDTPSGQPNVADDQPDGASDSTLDSQSVSVARSQPDGGKQDQGNRLEIDAPEGPAGLGDRPADNAGIMVRPASRDSEQIQPNLNSRFRKREFGGTPAISPDAIIAKQAFRKRAPTSLASNGEPTTEAAIHSGLKFLARYQLPDGSWSLTGFDVNEILHRNQFDSDTAATGLALLAFQGAGYNHREFKYAAQIEKAIQWLVEHQSDDGGLYVSSDPKSDASCRLYSHGIATLALTEAYGMTQDPKLKQPAQKAIDFIIETQDARHGGWRYFSEAANRSSDTSVSGWMMMALQSGRLAGLDVDDQGLDSIDDWLDSAADPENESLFRYNPFGVDAQGASRLPGRQPTASMTSVGLLMRIYSGWDRSDPRLLAGADFLLQTKLPADTTPHLRDTYYWYYATQVLKHVDGPRWKQWNDRLRPLLIRSQEKSGDLAGSWDPYKPVPDRWGKFGGRIYVTTMNLLSLEVRHRMLPLYRQTQPEKTDHDEN